MSLGLCLVEACEEKVLMEGMGVFFVKTRVPPTPPFWLAFFIPYKTFVYVFLLVYEMLKDRNAF